MEGRCIINNIVGCRMFQKQASAVVYRISRDMVQMDKLSVLLAIAILFNLVLNIFSSDGEKEIHFSSISEDSEIYFFE